MAMDYLGLGLPTMWGGAVFGMLAMALAGLWLARRFLELGAPADLATRTSRTAFAFRTVVLPAALGMLLILPFRMPGSLDQVVLVPVFVAALGVVWILAGAWRFAEVRPAAQGLVTLAMPAAALVALLAIFQLILRRGIAF
jgi:hypothetical protein